MTTNSFPKLGYYLLIGEILNKNSKIRMIVLTTTVVKLILLSLSIHVRDEVYI